jgi:DNA-binding CsgD family transcriptional regulator
MISPFACFARPAWPVIASASLALVVAAVAAMPGVYVASRTPWPGRFDCGSPHARAGGRRFDGADPGAHAFSRTPIAATSCAPSALSVKARQSSARRSPPASWTTSPPPSRALAATEFPELTDREREILELVAAGYRNADIAHRLVLSPNTVRNYVLSIVTKLQVSDRGHAIIRARKAGLGGAQPT